MTTTLFILTMILCIISLTCYAILIIHDLCEGE